MAILLQQVMMEWVDLKGLARDKAAQNEFITLMEAYKKDPDKWRFIYTWDTLNRDWYYLDGRKKKPFEKHQN